MKQSSDIDYHTYNNGFDVTRLQKTDVCPLLSLTTLGTGNLILCKHIGTKDLRRIFSF